MASVLRYSFLLIGICLRRTSWADSMPQVTSLIGSVGNEIIIQCATDKTPQDVVYLYKQEGASQNKQDVFFYYKDGTLSYKSEWYRNKVKVTGTFPNPNVTILNLKATDTGFYWCEFNFEDTISVGTVTWLWIEKSVHKNINKTEANEKDDEKECSGDLLHHWKIFLIVCAVMMLLCITAFILVILKVKGYWRNKKYRPSNPPSDSVYEEMKRSNTDGQPSVRTVINPDYQSTNGNFLH